MKKVWLIGYFILITGWIFLSSLNLNAQNLDNQVESPSLVDNTELSYFDIEPKWRNEGLRDDITLNASISPLGFFEPKIIFADAEKGDVLKVDEDMPKAEFNINVPEKGLYALNFEYKAITESVRNIEVSIMINDIFQYKESKSIIIPTFYDNPDELIQDRYGNDIMPVSTRYETWNDFTLRDTQRLVEDVLLFKLEAGNNKISIIRQNGDFLLSKVIVKNKKVLPTYNEYIPEGLLKIESGLITLEAEQPVFRNSLSIRYGTDREKNVTPFALQKQKLNIVDGGNYQTGGQALYYDINVKTAGFYYITLKTKQLQNFQTSFRRITINGEVPFQEANLIPFKNSKKWVNSKLGSNGVEYVFKLKEGKNRIGIEVNVSPFAKIHQNLNEVMIGVNDISLDLKKLAGSTTDKNREWDILSYLPNVVDELQHYYDLLVESERLYQEINGSTKVNETISAIRQSYETLKKLIDKPNTLPKNIDKLSTDSNSVTAKMGLVIPLVLRSPLSIDKIYIHGKDDKLPRANANFLQSFWLGIRRFFLSFFNNEYKPTKNSEVLEVWVNRSRQYVNVMQEMADATFTRETGIKVNISLMPDEGKLIMAVSAGSQPDVALGVSGWRPYDYALRNAVTDLKQFPTFKEVSKRFNKGAFLQLIYEEGVYALPETQNFNLLFYREDIMNKLNIQIPDTWDDVLSILPELQRYGLNFFAPLSTTGAFKGFVQTMPFIKQHQGKIHSDDALRTTIDSEEVIKAMTLMTDLYTIYSLPLEVGSFYNSFRYGDIPIGIGDFGMYVRLLHAAPEIAGLWKIAKLPGMMRSDGIVDRSYDGASTSGIIFEKSNKKEDAWKFLDWWTRDDTQLNYANNLINSMGPEYMWNTSNVNAFKEMAWDELDKQVFLDQWEWVNDTEKTPASYMIERELSNAWNRVVFDGINVRTAIEDATVIINKEITRKMKEFGYLDKNGNHIKSYVIPTKDRLGEILWD
ncbi:MAG TPA: extracellular solute-binding protein [Acholeplasmataceae bacterium]|jgi:ABC-type glycerol-3-phosphate transport system substrate-binding protein|nr:extracellular solute-binding protein [Acholeplasmataceae bacterium]